MSQVVILSGFPATANLIKVKLLVERTAKQHHVNLISVTTDSRSLQIKFSSDKDVDKFKRHFHSYSFGGAEHVLKYSKADDVDDVTGDVADESSAPSVDFSKVLSWMDIEDTFVFSNQEGLLLQLHDIELDALHLMQYFHDQVKSNKGSIRRAFCMHDGILLVLNHDADMNQIFEGENQASVTIEGKSVKAYKKDIPDYFQDRWLLELLAEEDACDDTVKMLVENVSPVGVSFEVKRTDKPSFLVIKYEANLAKDDFDTILKKAKNYEMDLSVKVSVIRRTDCITVSGLKPNFQENVLKMKLESREYGKIVTKIEKMKNGVLLVYFSSFKHAEDILDKYGEHGWNVLKASLTVKPYFHCLSNAHHSLQSQHKIDVYRQAMLDHQLAPMSFIYTKIDREVLSFVQTRPRYWQKLMIRLQGYAHVEVEKMEEISFKVAPVSVNVAKDRKEFTDHCTKILDDFFSQFVAQESKFEAEHLVIVRTADVDPVLDGSGSDDYSKDYKISWTGIAKDTAVVSGIKVEVERVLENIKNLTDIDNDTLEISEEQYRWLVDSGTFSKLDGSLKCHVKKDNTRHCLSFYGSRTLIRNANLEFLKAINLVVEVKLDSLDQNKMEYLTTHSQDRVTEQAKGLLKTHNAILIIRRNTASIWCHVKNMDDARKEFHKALVEEEMQLTPEEKEVTQIQEWEKERIKIEKKNIVLIKVTNSKVLIVGFERTMVSTKQKIANCLSNFSMKEKFFKTKYGKAECILQHCKDFLNCDGIDRLLVKMVLNQDCAIALKGRKNPVEKVHAVLGKQSICEDEEKYEHFGIANYFGRASGKIQLDEIASANECIVLVENMIQFNVLGTYKNANERTEAIDDIHVVPISPLPETKSDQVTKQPDQQKRPYMFSYQVYIGDIMKVKNDGIVNSIGQDFKLSNGGQVCTALLNVKNGSLQTELNAANGSTMRVTSGGSLQAQYIFHVHFSKDKSSIKSRLLETLRKADELKCKSLAMPAVGTGSYGMNESEVAVLMNDVLRNFTGGQFLENVDIVIYNKKIFPEFKKAFGNASTSAVAGLPSSHSNHDHSLLIGSVNVKLKTGDITEETTSAIANSTGEDFNLSHGMVSSKILQKAGEKIQREVHSTEDKYVRVTSGGSLPCKHIIHAAVPDRSGDKIKDCVENILRKAENNGYHSLSLPAFGAGKLGINCEMIARAMKKSIYEFASGQTPVTNVKEIVIVVNEKGIFPYFYREIFENQGTKKTSATQQSSNGCRSHRINLRPDGTAEYEKTFGQVRLVIEKGDITEARTDAVVNSVGSGFNLSAGGVAKAISEKAGPNIQEEVSKLSGNIRVTSGGKLHSKNIIHSSFDSSTTRLSKGLQAVFDVANSNGYITLSVPPVGTGILGMATKTVAEAFGDAIQCWALNHSRSMHLKEIRITILENSKFTEFLDVLIPDHRALKVDTSQRITTPETDIAPVSEATTTATVQITPHSILSSIGRPVDELFSSVQIGRLRIKIVEGDITEQSSDAIVCSVSPKFDLTRGEVPRKILEAGGNTIKNELDAAGESELRVTSGGNLPCKKIMHLVYTTDSSKASEYISRLLKRVDDEKCATVALPALGTGTMHRATVDCSKCILAAIRDFALCERSLKYLEEVSIVIHETTKFLKFLEQLTNIGHLEGDLSACQAGASLKFYARSKNKIAAAKTGIRKLVNQNFEVFKKAIPNLSDILKWKSAEIDRLKAMNIVDCKIDEHQSTVEVAGRKDFVGQVFNAIRLLSTELSTKAEYQSMALFSWKYGGPDSTHKVWMEFDKLSSVYLEEAYQSHKSQFQLQHQGKMCVVEFEKQMMTSKQDRYQCAVKREVRDEFPKHWAPMDKNEDCSLILLDSGSNEFNQVQQKLLQTVQKATIQSIHRIQNKKLYLRYYHERKRVQEKDESKEIEMQLFHGTSSEVADKIIKGGFDRGYAAEKNFAAFGRGTYFAKDASYSDQKKYSTPDSDGTKTMLLTRVVTGDYKKGSRELKAAPTKSNGEAYNCTVNDEQNPTIFVIFTDVGTYPEYVIKYKS